MKKFFEQYGGVALGILALLVLIAMITPVGNIIKTSLQGTVTKFSGSMHEQLDDAMNATATAQKNSESIPVDISNINTALATGDFSTKGSLVTVNGKSYKVLESNGTQVKLLAMDSYKESVFNPSFVATDFNGTTGPQYSGSRLDTYMTNFYNSLPTELQNAIVEQNISQSMYIIYSGTNASANFSAWWKSPFNDATTSGYSYWLTRVAEINVGARKVFALDVDDVISYLGSNSTAKDVNELFFGVRNNVSRLVWLRSAETDGPFRVNGRCGYLDYSSNTDLFEVRPAFVLDLSLLS